MQKIGDCPYLFLFVLLSVTVPILIFQNGRRGAGNGFAIPLFVARNGRRERFGFCVAVLGQAGRSLTVAVLTAVATPSCELLYSNAANSATAPPAAMSPASTASVILIQLQGRSPCTSPVTALTTT